MGEVALFDGRPLWSRQVARDDLVVGVAFDVSVAARDDVLRFGCEFGRVVGRVGQDGFDIVVLAVDVVGVGAEEGSIVDDVLLVGGDAAFLGPVDGRDGVFERGRNRRVDVGARREDVAALDRVTTNAKDAPHAARRVGLRVEAGKRLHLAVGGIEPCGERTSGRHGEFAVDHGKVSVRRQAEIVSGAVVAHAVLDVRHRVVAPEDFAVWIDGGNVDAFLGPDAGADVNNVGLQNRATTHGPARTKAAVDEQSAVGQRRRRDACLPDEFSCVILNAAKASIVGAKDYFAVNVDRRETNRAFRDDAPLFLACFEIIGGNAVGRVGRNEDQPPGGDWRVGHIGAHAELVVIGRIGQAEVERPAAGCFGRAVFVGRSGSIGVVAPLRPVGGGRRHDANADDERCQSTRYDVSHISFSRCRILRR